MTGGIAMCRGHPAVDANRPRDERLQDDRKCCDRDRPQPHIVTDRGMGRGGHVRHYTGQRATAKFAGGRSII
jgi:hypothetical protein